MEKRNLEQRSAIKFCVKLNENATESYEKLKRAYGEHALSRTRVFRWYKAFLGGRESVEDEPRSGRPCTSKTSHVRPVVRVCISLYLKAVPSYTVNYTHTHNGSQYAAITPTLPMSPDMTEPLL